MRRRASLPPLLVALAACAPPSVLSPDARAELVRESAQTPRFLRVAVYAGPFFGDEERLLLSDRPAAEFALSEGPGAKPLAPPAFERVLAPGTPLFVERMEFPTGATALTRPPSTPRDRPWVLGRVAGEKRPVVLVLSSRALRADDVRAELGRLLTSDDPGPALRALPEAQRAAIGRKEVVDGMGREAAAMAWGYPDRIAVDDLAHSEEWTWSDGLRSAVFQDDRLVHFESRRADRPGT